MYITINDEVEIKPLKSKDNSFVKNNNLKLHLHIPRLSHHTKKKKLELSWRGKPKSIMLLTSLKYSKDKKTTKKNSYTATLYIGWSFLIQRVQITSEQMATIMTSSTIVTKLASKWIKLPKHSITEALELVSLCINVQLVEAVNYTATYYGKLSSDNSDVCVLVKAQKGEKGQISVEIKTISQEISDGLMAELENMFCE